MVAGATPLAPARGRLEPGVVERVVDRIDGRAGQDDLVDAIQHRFIQRDLRGGELALELLHRPWSDDGRGDRRVVEHEADGELDQREAGLFGELRELLDGVELALV